MSTDWRSFPVIDKADQTGHHEHESFFPIEPAFIEEPIGGVFPKGKIVTVEIKRPVKIFPEKMSDKSCLRIRTQEKPKAL